AHHVARGQDNPLLERTFFLRYQASLGFSDPAIAAAGEAWERERLIAATVALLKDRVYVTGATRLVVEQGEMNLAAALEGLRDGMPHVSLVAVASERFAGFTPEPGDFMLAEYWGALATPGTDAARAAGRIAVADVIASLRLPG